MTPEEKLEKYYARVAEEDQGGLPVASDMRQRASSIGKCLRSQGYQFLDYEGEPLTYRDLMPMRFGTWLHVGLQADMSECGIIEGEEEQLKKTYKVKVKGKTLKFSIVGHKDGHRTVRAGRIIQEIKTLGDWRFKSRVNAFPGQLWEEVHGFHREMLQTAAYADMDGAIGSEVWWWNRSNGKKLFHREKYTPEHNKRLMRRIRELAHLATQIQQHGDDALPEADVDYKPSAGICKICRYKYHCWGSKAQSYG
jgi:hypothetical protein